MAFDYFKWSQKQYKKEGKILKKGFKRKLTDAEKLKLLELKIYPYSINGRFGMKKALRHAIKLLNSENRLVKQSKLNEEKIEQSVNEGLIALKELKEACETHMGRMVYILQEDKFELIEKELRDRQEIKEIAKYYKWDDITGEIFNVETDKKYRDLFDSAIINIQEDYRKARTFDIIKNLCNLKVYKNKLGQCFLEGTNILFPISQETYDLFKKVLL